MEMHNSHWDNYMHEALSEAQLAYEHHDIPIGAVVVNSAGEIIARAHNVREQLQDPLGHAELIALQLAAKDQWNLADCTLIVTLEPCPMCAGAAMSTHIGRIIFGAWDDKMGACGSIWDLPRDPHRGASCEIYGGVLEEECSQIIREFFEGLRLSERS